MQPSSEKKLSKRKLTRTFVYLEKKQQVPPSGSAYTELEKKGRVKEISFTRSDTESQIGRLILSTFPILLGTDLNRLSFIKTYSSGHSMAEVCQGLLSGNELANEYSASDKKKRVYFLLGQPATSTCVSTTTDPTQANRAQVDLTQSPPRNGAATRRLLTAMAQRAATASTSTATNTCATSGNQTQATAQVDLTQSPAENGDHRSVLTMEPTTVGDTTEELHFPACFERKKKKNVNCRTEEVVTVTQQLYSIVNCTLPMFLPHTLEEVLWQAREEAAVCLLFLWSEKNVGNCINFLFKFLDNEINKKKSGKFLFWLADSQSSEGTKVQSRYGVGDQMSLLVLVPTPIPQCVEIFNDANADAKKMRDALISAELQCLQLKEQSKNLEARRSLVATQRKELEQLRTNNMTRQRTVCDIVESGEKELTTKNATPQRAVSDNVECREKESQDSTSKEQGRDEEDLWKDETEVTFRLRSPEPEDDMPTTAEDEIKEGVKGKKKKSKKYKNKKKKDKKKEKRKASRIPLDDEPPTKK